MPTRRRMQHRHSPPPQDVLSESDSSVASAAASDEDPDADEAAQFTLGPDDLSSSPDQAPGSDPSSPPLSPAHLPPNLREISTLASWTVSSSKPGCSIPQLRHPSPNLFWQSDGPQPHYLNIHFFKLVRIVGLRLYLDFEQDESYTPTRIVLLAGSGMNDLVEWGEMRLESPRGWVWADFSGVGDPDDEDGEEEDEDGDDGDGGAPMHGVHHPPDAQANVPQAGPPRDDTSDFENTTPGPAAPPAGAATPSPGITPNGGDAMLVDEQMHTQMPLPQHQHQHQHHHHHPLATPTGPAPQGTPSLPRPHPRAPFAPLSPTAPPPPRAPASPRKPKMPVLRCHLVQIKIMENHQNGKDTHLRGLQIFARDNEKEERERARTVHTVRETGRSGSGREGEGRAKREVKGFMRSEWMDEPVLR